MKSIFLVLLVTFQVKLYCQGQEAKQVNSVIENVTVFLTGAQLEQTCEVDLKNGKQSIAFIGLSPELDPNSVVIEADPKNVTILSVNTRNNYMKPLPDNRGIGIARDSMNMITDRVSALTNEIATLEKEKDLLFKNEAIGGVTQGVAISEIEKAADFFRNRTNGINNKIFTLRKELNQANTRLAALNQQLTELNAQYNPPTSEVTLELTCPQGVKAKFRLKYMVESAGWSPKYDVRAESVNEDIRLVYRANVFNGCGLDWQQVNMKLSTASPMKGAEKPLLEAWDITQSAQLSTVEIIAGGVPGNLGDYGGVVNKDKAGVRFDMIEVQELSSEFVIAIPYTILSDRKPYTVDVTEHKLAAKYEYYAAPVMDNDAFLTAKVTGWNQLNLVSGKASVYFAGTYLGQSMINTNSTEDTLTLSLGRDNLIAINRTKESELSKRQFIGNNEKETFFFRTTVRNNHDRQIAIIVEDQIPISTKGDVMVDALDRGDGKLEERTGKITWTFTLQPGESKVIPLGYSVKSPKGSGIKKKKFRTISSPSF